MHKHIARPTEYFLGCFATDISWFVMLWFAVGPDLNILFISIRSASLFLFWIMVLNRFTERLKK